MVHFDASKSIFFVAAFPKDDWKSYDHLEFLDSLIFLLSNPSWSWFTLEAVVFFLLSLNLFHISIDFTWMFQKRNSVFRWLIKHFHYLLWFFSVWSNASTYKVERFAICLLILIRNKKYRQTEEKANTNCWIIASICTRQPNWVRGRREVKNKLVDCVQFGPFSRRIHSWKSTTRQKPIQSKAFDSRPFAFQINFASENRKSSIIQKGVCAWMYERAARIVVHRWPSTLCTNGFFIRFAVCWI